MDKIIDDLRVHFASQQNGIRPLASMPVNYKAFSFRNGAEFGVAIETGYPKEVYAESAQIVFKTFENGGVRYIALSSYNESFRNEFAIFGASFVSPGDNGENREKILNTPFEWWESWVGMLGNRFGTQSAYDTIAEMMALNELYSQDKSFKWTASQAGSHDIESPAISVEVKSTVMKSESKVTISSQFQLDSVGPLQLWFYRMEASEQGISINDLKDKLLTAGYDEGLLESELAARKFLPGNNVRDKKYVVLEKRKYNVDQNFPRIVESSFKNNVYPKNIVKILYTIDLEGLDYTS